jgi:CheY-like chemotaxis protein
MLTPLFFSPESPTATYSIDTLSKLIKHLETCSQEQFTGQLDLELQTAKRLKWSLFFRLGRLIWATSNVHPIRRWCRQLSQFCPQLTVKLPETAPSHYWNYDALVELVRQRKIPESQMVAVIEGNIAEVLFDILQLCQQHKLKTQLSYRTLSEAATASAPVSVQIEQIWRQVELAWDDWQKAGLVSISPNLAPVIWDMEELRQQTPMHVYRNLTAMINGNHTLRDLGVKLKQNPLLLTLSLLSYIRGSTIGLVEVNDLSCTVQSPRPEAAPLRLIQTESVSPLVAYIDDSRFDSLTMNRVLAHAGYQFINIRDPVQALPTLLEQKPGLVFLDLLMPVTNGYEVCAQIRRVSAFKDIPIIIVTASDGLVDRVRAKLVGSTGFISKPIEPEKVLPLLQQYLPIRSSKVQPPTWASNARI